MRCVALLTALLALTSIARGQDQEAFAYFGPGFSANLPSGFALNAALDDALPDFGHYSFTNEASGHFVSVSVHTYFDDAQRAGWGLEEGSESRLAHLENVQRMDGPELGFPVSAAYLFEHRGARGLAVFGCDAARCYQLMVSGATEEAEATVDYLSGLAIGVEFEQ